ncbi:unnamed protein product [Calypogeia fissa]
MASEQAQAVEQNLQRFFHDYKTEHPPPDAEMETTRTRQAEHNEKRGEENEHTSLIEPKERRVKDAAKQADHYGREMTVAQQMPQTLDPFAASGESSPAKEPRDKGFPVLTGRGS